jgi:hypothetical protein
VEIDAMKKRRRDEVRLAGFRRADGYESRL